MVDQRFPKDIRLRTAAEFRVVFQRPMRANDACFTVLARDNQLAFARLGFAIAKKKVKRAVDRNRIKRVVREVFRLQHHNLGHFDFVVIAKMGLANKSNIQITRSILKHWAMIQQKCDKSLL